MKALTLGALCAAVVAAPVAAQDRSVFSVLDPADRVVSADGTPARGSLTSEDLVAAGARRFQVWRLDADVGEELQVDLRSGDFDAFVYVVGPGLGEGLSDDDGGDGLNARICVMVDEPGEYRVVASSLSSATGGYTLQVARREGVTDGACPEDVAETVTEVDDIALLPTDGRTLSIGSDVQGELSSTDPTFAGSPSQAWAFEGTAGQSVSVDLVSDAFDAYLMVQGPGLESWLRDDDGAGGCNSRVSFELAESGLYRVVASSLGTDVGPYSLITTGEPGPESDAPCSVGSSDAVEESLDAIALVGSLTWEAEQQGTFTENEATYEERTVQGWTLESDGPTPVSIEVRSSDFDSYVYLTGPGFEYPISNDDGGGNLNSRLCAELPYAGTYRVFAGSYSTGILGQIYTVRASRENAASECEPDAFEISEDAVGDWLLELPTEGRTIALDSETQGTFEEDDPRHPDADHLIQPWSFRGTADRTVYVDVVSDEFDTVVYAVGAGIDGVLFIDDGEAGCNARMSITPSESGGIQLLPGSLYGDVGDFVLRVSENPPALEDNGCDFPEDASASTGDPAALDGVSSGVERPIELIAVVSDSLTASDERRTSGQPAQAWTLPVEAGEEIEVTLVSDAFDPILFIDGPTLSPPLMDDDSAGDLDSRITVTPTEDGVLRIVVSAYSADATGAFELRIARRQP